MSWDQGWVIASQMDFSMEDNGIWGDYIGNLRENHIILQDCNDSLVWMCVSNRRYSPKDGYNVLMLKT